MEKNKFYEIVFSKLNKIFVHVLKCKHISALRWRSLMSRKGMICSALKAAVAELLNWEQGFFHIHQFNFSFVKVRMCQGCAHSKWCSPAWDFFRFHTRAVWSPLNEPWCAFSHSGWCQSSYDLWCGWKWRSQFASKWIPVWFILGVKAKRAKL